MTHLHNSDGRCCAGAAHDGAVQRKPQRWYDHRQWRGVCCCANSGRAVYGGGSGRVVVGRHPKVAGRCAPQVQPPRRGCDSAARFVLYRALQHSVAIGVNFSGSGRGGSSSRDGIDMGDARGCHNSCGAIEVCSRVTGVGAQALCHRCHDCSTGSALRVN